MTMACIAIGCTLHRGLRKIFHPNLAVLLLKPIGLGDSIFWRRFFNALITSCIPLKPFRNLRRILRLNRGIGSVMLADRKSVV
jgi:hypothetical protein